MRDSAYPKVPITLVETCVLLSEVNFASPKSATCKQTPVNKGETMLTYFAKNKWPKQFCRSAITFIIDHLII